MLTITAVSHRSPCGVRQLRLQSPSQRPRQYFSHPPREAAPEIIFRNLQLLPVPIYAPETDVDMGLIGVVMVYRDPVQRPAQILLDLAHGGLGKGREINLCDMLRTQHDF